MVVIKQARLTVVVKQARLRVVVKQARLMVVFKQARLRDFSNKCSLAFHSCVYMYALCPAIVVEQAQ
jgi:hypothetical protein